MGDAKTNKAILDAAIAELRGAGTKHINGCDGSPQPRLELSLDKAAVVLALDRVLTMLQIEANQMQHVLRQQDAAKEFYSAADHIAKFRVKLIAEHQRTSLVLATPADVPGLKG